MSKGNVESPPAIPQGSVMIHGYACNGLKEKKKTGTRRNRPVTQFSGVRRDMVESVGNRMEYITLFDVPFPDAQRTEDILDKLWRDAEREQDKDYTRYNKIDAYVSHWGLHYLRDRH